MAPLTPADFDLECDLASWEAATDEEAERHYDDVIREYRDSMEEAEALELAAGARMRPLSE